MKTYLITVNGVTYEVQAEEVRGNQQIIQQVVQQPAPAPQPAAAPAPAPRPAPASYDTVALSGVANDINEFETKIKKLKVLRDNGILTEEEYLEEKKKLVSIF